MTQAGIAAVMLLLVIYLTYTGQEIDAIVVCLCVIISILLDISRSLEQ